MGGGDTTGGRKTARRARPSRIYTSEERAGDTETEGAPKGADNTRRRVGGKEGGSFNQNFRKTLSAT